MAGRGRRSATWAVTIVAGAVAVVPAATAAKTDRHRHVIKEALLLQLISTTGNPAAPPQPGDRLVEAGTAHVSPGGDGAEVDHVSILGFSGGAELYSVTSTTYLPSGSLTSKVKGRAVHNADGTTSFTGTGTWVSGTGRFKGITGHSTFTGSAPAAPGPPETINVTGSATY